MKVYRDERIRKGYGLGKSVGKSGQSVVGKRLKLAV